MVYSLDFIPYIAITNSQNANSSIWNLLTKILYSQQLYKDYDKYKNSYQVQGQTFSLGNS